MRKFLLILVSWICVSAAWSQSSSLDSVRNLLSKSKPDTNALRLMSYLAYGYSYFNPDSSYYFGRQEYILAGRLGDKLFEADGLIKMGFALRQMGNYPKALEYGLQSLKISEQKNDQAFISYAVSEISTVYYFQKDGKNCIAYAFRALNLHKSTTDFSNLAGLYQQISSGYELMKMYDSSLFYIQKSYQMALKSHDEQMIAYGHENLADGYFELHKDSLAFMNYKLAFPYFVSHPESEGTCEAALSLAQLFERKNKPDSATWYGQLSLNVAQSSMLTSRQSETSDYLAAFYKRRASTRQRTEISGTQRSTQRQFVQ